MLLVSHAIRILTDDYHLFYKYKNTRNDNRTKKKMFRNHTFTKIQKLAHIRMDFAGIMQTIGIKGRYVGFTYIRPLYGFAPFWRS